MAKQLKLQNYISGISTNFGDNSGNPNSSNYKTTVIFPGKYAVWANQATETVENYQTTSIFHGISF
jgi:hypothetical protein